MKTAGIAIVVIGVAMVASSMSDSCLRSGWAMLIDLLS
jgi:hypothetical protein